MLRKKISSQCFLVVYLKMKSKSSCHNSFMPNTLIDKKKSTALTNNSQVGSQKSQDNSLNDIILDFKDSIETYISLNHRESHSRFTPSEIKIATYVHNTSREFQDILLQVLQPDKNDQSNEFDRLITVLTKPEILIKLSASDPLTGARLRGLQVKQNLLTDDGQPLNSAAVAEILGISRQAVDKRRKSGKLLAVSLGKRGYFYPVFQFGNGELLTGLEEILEVLAKFDPWTQLMFLKTGDLRLGNRTPLECLIDGEVFAVIEAANCYGEPYPA
jgi:hypothetical protein